MQRRVFLAAGAAALILIRQTAMAAVSADDAGSSSAPGRERDHSLTGSTLSPHDRETRFRALLVADFDMLGSANSF